MTIWDEWATRRADARASAAQEGDLGPVYGHQWRNFGATPLPDGTLRARRRRSDRARCVERDPGATRSSRRLIVTGWNPKEADQVALPPCHTLFQFYVQDGEL